MENKSYITEKVIFMSTDSQSTVFGYICTPLNNEIKGIIQICHGMCEYFLNYENLINYFTLKGFAVCGHDHLGHGETANNKVLGYFGEKNGYNYLAGDVFGFYKILKERFPIKPFIFFGHSMGSFIGRYFLVKYKNKLNFSCAIICGTSGKNPLTKIAKKIAKIRIYTTKKQSADKFLDFLAFKPYNKNIENSQSNFSWLSRDEDVGKAYEKNKKRNFIFTSEGFLDLFILLDKINSNWWFENFDKNLPVLITSGDKDPVGNYGKGVTEVFDKLKNTGVDSVSLLLFKNARHEPHNEINKNEVFNSWYNWISKINSRK
ncbi:MAG: alpha/beta fold hydrolase [Oscillospiraceae bacterium]